ncbi:MAG: hypothetical protein KBC41_03030 [Candidatus Pacebacteria bacterium]|nr:hypothetical protein [Candidatus Paceibacterota bacterium]MBP9867025.1 hypothetical protein [Candidatus Paceibacterota bacterium]
MKKLFFSIFLATQSITLSVYALETAPVVIDQEKQDTYNACKKSALDRREVLMTPARKEYVLSSQTITDKAKKDFDKIKWYIPSSYMPHAKKIQDEKNQAMLSIQEKIAKVRSVAFSTWKAENALCDFQLASNEKEKNILVKK